MSRFGDDSPILSHLEESDSNKPEENEQEEQNDSPQNQAVLQKLEELQQSRQGGQQDPQVAQLLADPQVRQLLDARQRGEEVEIVNRNQRRDDSGKNADTTTTSEDIDLDNVDIDSMDNKEFAKFISKLVGKSVDNKVSELQKQIDNRIKENVEPVQSFVHQQQKQTIESQISKAREKYDDFDDAQIQQDMIQLHRDNPGLNVEELYMNAKWRRGEEPKKRVQPDPKANSSTERPSTSGGRPSARPKREKPLPKGQRGFSQALTEGADRIDFDSILKRHGVE